MRPRMVFRLGIAVGFCLLTAACASAPSYPARSPTSLVSMMLGQTGPTPQATPPIGLSEIQAARTLLSQAQAELEPRQYEVLEKGLVEAEAVFQRYVALAKVSGEVAEVARGAEAVAATKRASQIADGLGTVSRVGPLLVALAVVWPNDSIATQSQEFPPKQVAERDLQAALIRVATDSRRVGEEIDAARRSQEGRRAAEKAGAAAQKAGSGQPPGDPPCFHFKTEGEAQWRPPGAPHGPIKCIYLCGKKQIVIEVWGTSNAVCIEPSQLERAEKEAERQRKERR